MVTECFANLSHEVREIRFFDERLRPEPCEQLRLGEDFWTIQDQRCQQLECLGREVNLAACLRQPSGVEIERERAEANPHTGSLASRAHRQPRCDAGLAPAESPEEPARSLEVP
jgi:hypothetical protein